ncbi:hypothetical protein HHK36_015433 [Tetracentron sinense]|uniref:Protein FAR1-RELATED SEQUENCE n=1 Tax=Tetracentron sinense TaxID=13715 RepID=A0A834Z661_TETSI|nr:hypothetical protein HHK36_015433 [Tetracentron sinense]
MEEEPVDEGEDLMESYVVLDDEEGEECCVVEDVEVPMVVDDAKTEDSMNLELSQCLVGGIIEPTVDMEFSCEEDARNFYNAYAKQMGFSIRVNSYYRSKKDNSIISREFCCSKEGFRREKRARKINYSDDAKRRRARPITREGCKALMTVRRRDCGKWYVAKLEKNHNHELVTPAMRHFLRSHKQEYDPKKSFIESLGSPGMGTSSTVNVLTEECGSFGQMGFAAQDQNNYIGKGRLSTFGIDAQTIRRAVEKVFPESCLRYCKWHIMSKMPKELGYVYSALPKTFQLEFDKCINKSETPEEFELAWESLLDRYNLRGNDWLQSLYIDRKGWVPTYLRDTFFAGMSATQRSGSVNSLFDGYVNSRTTLQDFAEQYEKALDDRFEKEAKAEFDTFYTKPFLKTPLPIEKQAAEVYTRKMFTVFQEEIFESLVLAVKISGEDGATSIFEVARFDEEHKVYSIAFNVSEQRASCSCRMFEVEGVLCRHLLAVFKATNVFMLPSHYILKRWTINAKDEAMLDILPSVEMQTNSEKDKNSQYNVLYQEAVKCAEEGVASDHSFQVALSALREARTKIVNAKKNAANATKLETMTSTSYQDENCTIGSQVDSSTILITPFDCQTIKTSESPSDNIKSKSVLEQPASRIRTCTKSMVLERELSCYRDEDAEILVVGNGKQLLYCFALSSDSWAKLVRSVLLGPDLLIIGIAIPEPTHQLDSEPITPSFQTPLEKESDAEKVRSYAF